MSKLTDGIQKAVRNVEDFNHTPEGSVVMHGISNILNLGLSALIIRKLFPAKATFGSAICAGMLCIASTAAIGHASVLREWFRNAYETDNARNNMRARIECIINRITELNGLLLDKEISIKELHAEIENLRQALETVEDEC